MERPSLSTSVKLLAGAALLGGGLGFVSSGAANGPEIHDAEPNAPSENFLEGLNPLDYRRDGAALVSPLPAEREAVLTLEPGLQSHLIDEFESYAVPYGAVVAIEPATGRVLAYVSHSTANPDAPDLNLDVTPPTASVFKVITGAALIDAGIEPDQRVCYHGGFSRLEIADLEDDPDRDRLCGTLAEAMGGSINSIFAKLADRTLSETTLARYASAFGFGEALPFDVPTFVSPSEVPTERLEFARTAAGFWHMHMSPLHGALIAATIANDGRMPRAAIVDHVREADGDVVYRHEPSVFREVISAATARTTGVMMRRTVTHGTARRAFHDPQGRPFLPGIEVAGKTGTLSASNPYRGYTWWVGFAPADAPQIAVAALVVNTPRWRIKASYIARETLRYYLVERVAPNVARDVAPAPEQPVDGSELSE